MAQRNLARLEGRQGNETLRPAHTNKAHRRRPFHLAPLVCLKFRGRKLAGEEADRATKGALANYVVNTEKGLKSNPKLAFALCYVAAHLVLDLLDEQTAGEIMGYCEEHLPG